jgi:hypothetical protein
MEHEHTALDELPALRLNLRSEIQIAAKQGGKSTNIFELAERLRTGDALLEQVLLLWQRKSTPLSSQTSETSIAEDITIHDISAQQRGETVRSNWVNMMLGKAVRHERRSLYQNGRGETLGIAYALEAENRKNRWFLGLPINKFESAILLCESLDGKRDAICLPREFIAKHKEALSKANGQVKFNVMTREGEWYIKVPKIVRIKITENVNKLSLVI